MRQFITGLIALCSTALCFASEFHDETVQPPLVLQSAVDPPRPFYAEPVPRSAAICNDAGLNAVCCVGRNCWAVGERGVVLRSRDSGLTWETGMLPVECSLQSVSFLTDQHGFVAGFEFAAAERMFRGVMLSTTDGGETWNRVFVGAKTVKADGTLVSNELPPLKYIRFFDLEHGIALGDPQDPSTGSAIETHDGGRTWQVLPTETPRLRWKTAGFSDSSEGIVVGPHLTYGAVVAGKVITLSPPSKTLRSVNAAALSRDGIGLIAGDGGFLRRSTNGGITWSGVETGLPSQLSQLLDFQCVNQHGNQTVVAGTPGHVVLHSTDGGASWKFQNAHETAPIYAICRNHDDVLLAVGALGIVRRSSDGGQSWTTVRNAGYRTGLMSIVTDSPNLPVMMLAKTSAAQGIRSVAFQPSVRLVDEGTQQSVRQPGVSSAMSWVGGNAVFTDWNFARLHPRQETVRDRLIDAWDRSSDGRFAELLPLRLARAMRIWRPDVICIEQSAADDEVSWLWQQAIERARDIAAAQRTQLEPLTQIGLPAWKVSSVFRSTEATRSSLLTFGKDELLTNLATTTGLLSYPSQQWLHRDGPRPPEFAAAYEIMSSGDPMATPAGLFSGIPSDSASRRRIDTYHADSLDAIQQAQQRSQTQQAALRVHVARNQSGQELIAEVRRLGEQLPAELALKQLQNLVELYETYENLEGLIAVLKEVTRRFPDTPAAVDAAEKLFVLYSSEEIRKFRLLSKAPDSSAPNRSAPLVPGTIVKQPDIQRVSGTTFENSQGRDRAALSRIWNDNADAALQILESSALHRAHQTHVLLRKAANLRRRQMFGENSTVLTEAAGAGDQLAVLARAELQSVHGAVETAVPIFNLLKTNHRPFLDAVLNEEFWQDAAEIRLSGNQMNESSDSGCLLMMSWDPEFLYISGRIERVKPGPPSQRILDSLHDADHRTLDRIEFEFDIDRDYSTSFQFSIDEEGQTSERCWNISSWNPDWYRRCVQDRDVWRFEMAIPVAAMSTGPMTAGTLWAFRVRRVAPGYLQESLPAVGGSAQASGFGLLRFIRNRGR